MVQTTGPARSPVGEWVEVTNADIESGAFWLADERAKAARLEEWAEWVRKGRPGPVSAETLWEPPVVSEPKPPVVEWLPTRKARLDALSREREETSRLTHAPEIPTERPARPKVAPTPIGPVDEGGKYASESQASAFSEKYSMPRHDPKRKSQSPEAHHVRYMRGRAAKNGTTPRMEEQRYQRRKASRVPKEAP